MKFLIVTHVVHKNQEGFLYAYEPYVREMNLWIKNFSDVVIIAPFSKETPNKIDDFYVGKNVILKQVGNFNLLTFKNKLVALLKMPFIVYKIFKAMKWAEHIHVRCPGNIGLIGCFIQIFFPSKPKTFKYAGNWDPKSKQPWSYRLQKRMISNTFLTKNAKVLVYGDWPNQTKNIKPFFTATYSKNDVLPVVGKELKKSSLQFIYVGTLHKGKQPILSVKIIEKLKTKGHNAYLEIYGEGEEEERLRQYINANNLEENIFLKGNKSKEDLKKAYKKAHFLIFISKSEGWPKVVAEAMFWGCVPITSKVSCVPWMLGNGKRGILIDDACDRTVVEEIEKLIKNNQRFEDMSLAGQIWSHKYTLEKFEEEIQKLLKVG